MYKNQSSLGQKREINQLLDNKIDGVLSSNKKNAAPIRIEMIQSPINLRQLYLPSPAMNTQ